MSLGGLLVGRGLVTLDDIDAALERQRTQGGRLGDNLIALGLLTAEQLLSVIHSTPPIPTAISETGIPQRSLLNLLLKFMHLEACETVASYCWTTLHSIGSSRRSAQSVVASRLRSVMH